MNAAVMKEKRRREFMKICFNAALVKRENN